MDLECKLSLPQCFRRHKKSEPEEAEEAASVEQRPKLSKSSNEAFFIYNGAKLLEESITSFEVDGNAKPIRIFSEKELKRATDNYAEDRIFTSDSGYTCYKGILEGARTITVKKPKISIYGAFKAMKAFINEAITLSHINHHNIVKLIGCCIETEIPILVCEYISDRSLNYSLRELARSSRIPWEDRLRIGTEIAYALSYLHTAISRPIVHRVINSSNIFLDEHCTIKITDLGQSVLIPLGETYVETEVIGTPGYFDPEYLRTSQLTEKSDVYSYGMIFIEVLTGKKPRDTNFSALGTELIDLVLETNKSEEGKRHQLIACAELALRCIKYKGEERPTMKQVVQELRGIKRSEHLSPN